MLKTKIEWCDSTWNPITGCRHECPYCYAKRMAERFSGYDPSYSCGVTQLANGCFELGKDEIKYKYASGGDGKPERKMPAPYPFGFEPTFHKYRLEQPKKWVNPQTIFVCSMADLFGAWVPTKWIVEVLDACQAAPQHRYIFLTKNPRRYAELDRLALLPREDNFWYGSTVTSKSDRRFNGHIRLNTFLSIEPLHENLDAGLGSFGGDRWIIIGAETGQRKEKIVPEKAWVDNICEAADLTRAAVFMKDSLIPIVGEENMRRELPWETSTAKGASQEAGATAAQDTLMPAT